MQTSGVPYFKKTILFKIKKRRYSYCLLRNVFSFIELLSGVFSGIKLTNKSLDNKVKCVREMWTGYLISYVTPTKVK